MQHWVCLAIEAVASDQRSCRDPLLTVRFCRKSTAKSLSNLRKKLSLFSAGAEHVHQVIKSFIESNCFITNFSFEEPEFCANDYVCSSCCALLTSYEKAKKGLEELQGEVKSCLQSTSPATVPPPWEWESSPIVSSLDRRRTRACVQSMSLIPIPWKKSSGVRSTRICWPSLTRCKACTSYWISPKTSVDMPLGRNLAVWSTMRDAKGHTISAINVGAVCPFRRSNTVSRSP